MYGDHQTYGFGVPPFLMIEELEASFPMHPMGWLWKELLMNP